MPRNLEEACAWTPAAATSSIATTVKQDIWLRIAIAVLRRRCTYYLQSFRCEKYSRVAAQCVTVAALKAARTIRSRAIIQLHGWQKQIGASDREA